MHKNKKTELDKTEKPATQNQVRKIISIESLGLTGLMGLIVYLNQYVVPRTELEARLSHLDKEIAYIKKRVDNLSGVEPKEETKKKPKRYAENNKR